jgi:hypothetical protein
MLIMKKFYTLFRSKALVAFLSFGLMSNVALAQPICGPIVENFNNTSGSTAGFTGDFVIGNAGGDGVLIKSRPIGTAVYTVTTPTYTLPAATSFIGYGFEVDGTERVARVEAAITYISTLNGEITTIFIAQFVPSYNNVGTSADVCRAIATSDLPGFPTGGSYRFRFELTPGTGSGLTTQNITFDDFRTNGTLAQSPLPVTFIGFDAKKLSTGVQLTWKVGGEENVNRYEVERSTDGRNFTTVGSVSTDKKDTYNYFDATTNSTIYYRIKNVDNDGKFKYSTIARIVNGKSTIVLKAFPQPVMGQLTIQHPVVTKSSLVTISAADGRIIRSVRPTTGSMQTYIDMSALKGGLYMVRFDAGNGEVETMKVVKQ